MKAASKTKWWQRRRFLWPAGALLLLTLASFGAVLDSGISRVIIANDSGGPISELTVAACGRVKTFHNVGDRESVALVLGGSGPASDIALATNGVSMWRGEYIEPKGGYREALRIRPDGEIVAASTISCWQRLLN